MQYAHMNRVVPAAFARSIVLALTVACSNDVVTAPLTLSQLCARKDSAYAQVGASRTIDDQFEVLARVLPGGFGGLTADYMYLKQLNLADTARAIARAVESCSGETPGVLLPVVQGVPTRQGDYDWVELRAWYRQLGALHVEGMTTSDMDERINRLSYTFMSETQLQAFRSQAIGVGVPDAALALSVAPPPTPLAAID